MRVTVLLFARCRDIVGTGETSLELAEGATAIEAFEALAAKYPRLAGMRSSLRLAVNEEYADNSQALKDGDTVALLPPVSGG